MEKKSILVVGATGFLGSEVCRQLVSGNYDTKGLIRSGSDSNKIRNLKDTGVETVTGDLKDPASIKTALKGVDIVISTASSTMSGTPGDSIDAVDRIGQLNLVDAAAAAGVRHFIYISFLESGFSFPLQDAKRAVEESIVKSKMRFTILRPTFFSEIWLSPALGFDAQNHKATIYGHGVNKLSFISLRDVAAFAVAAIDNNEAWNTIIDIGGPEAFSPLEVVKLFEDASGQKFQLNYVPEEALKQQYEMAADPLQKSFSALMLTLAAGGVIKMDETLKAFKIRPTYMREYVSSCLPATAETV